MQYTPTISQPASTLQQTIQPVYEISDADRARVKRIQQAWQAFEGDLPEPLAPMPGQPSDNVLSNRMGQIVNIGVYFLFGKELEISVDPDAPDEAQDLLEKTWGRKEARIPLLQKWAMSGAIAGTAFLRIVPNKNGTFRLIVVDPATVYIQTAPQDCETVQLYCIEYGMDQKINGRPQRVYYREEISRVEGGDDTDAYGYEDTDAFGLDEDDRWLIQHWTRIGDRGPWQSGGEPITWPYPFPPLFHNQNLPKPNDAWGYPDLTPDLISLNEALNITQSDIKRTLRIYANPFICASGVGESVLTYHPGQIFQLPPDAKMWPIAIQSDIPNALAFAKNLRSDMDELSSVPGVATGRIEVMPRGNLSGIAIELLFMPLLKKTELKECCYGKTIIDISKALLVLAGYSADIDISLAWQGPIPHDDLQSAQYAVLLKQLAISNTTLQRNLGFDPDEEAELNAAEAARNQPNIPPEQPVTQDGSQMAQGGQSPMMMGQQQQGE